MFSSRSPPAIPSAATRDPDPRHPQPGRTTRPPLPRRYRAPRSRTPVPMTEQSRLPAGLAGSAHQRPEPDVCFRRSGPSITARSMSGGSGVGLLSAQPGNALHAAAGPARSQTRPAAPAGRPQAGQPGGMRQELGSVAIARDGDDGPDAAARQGKPLPRPICGGAAWHWAHWPIFPASEPCQLLSPADPIRRFRSALPGRRKEPTARGDATALRTGSYSSALAPAVGAIASGLSAPGGHKRAPPRGPGSGQVS